MGRNSDGDEGNAPDVVMSPMDEADRIVKGLDYSKYSPTEVGVPHPEWRPNQLDALQKIIDLILIGDIAPVFEELPTGSGKSSLPTALAHYKPVLVLVESHALLDQYARSYGFKVVKGLASYSCILPKRVDAYKMRFGRAPTAAECAFKKMSECPIADRCPYLVARDAALASPRMAVTYAYAMLSQLLFRRQGITVCDESHLAAEIITGLCETTISQTFLQKFALPEFPIMSRYGLLDKAVKDKLRGWISGSLKVLENPPSNLFLDEEAEWVDAQARMKRFGTVLNDEADYFFEVDPVGHEKTTKVRGKVVTSTEPQLVVKPLRAASGFPKILGVRKHTVLMSATLSNPLPLASELGISDYRFYSYPHPVPVEARPVWDIGFPKMTAANLMQAPILSHLQATRIAAVISERFPKDWRGVIITASYAKRAALLKGLSTSPIADRINVPSENSVGERVNEFLEDPRPGRIAVDISHSFSHGVSLEGHLARFLALASVTFGDFTTKYAKVRDAYVSDKTYGWWKIYTGVTQACGRVSRGEKNEDGTWMFNAAILADGSATTPLAMEQYPKWFRESIFRI